MSLSLLLSTPEVTLVSAPLSFPTSQHGLLKHWNPKLKWMKRLTG